MKSYVNNERLVVALQGRVDSTNYREIEDQDPPGDGGATGPAADA